jgi:uncharacterized membrane protein YfcA
VALLETGLGLAVGVILALTGAGGGILAVPLLVFGTHLGVAQAGPIGLLAVGMAAALGAGLGLKAGNVRYKAALLIAGAGMLVFPAGLWLAHRTDNRLLSLLFAVVLLFVAFRAFRQSEPQAGHPLPASQMPPCVRNAGNGRFVWTSRCARTLALSGMVAGALSGLLGVGGGFVVVPAMRRFTDLTMQSAVATSLAVIALVSQTGVASTAFSGRLNWTVALPFALGALLGMVCGRALSSRLAGAQMQKVFALTTVAVAVGMVVKALT